MFLFIQLCGISCYKEIAPYICRLSAKFAQVIFSHLLINVHDGKDVKAQQLE